jgi:hypothetical protein
MFHLFGAELPDSQPIGDPTFLLLDEAQNYELISRKVP